MARRLVATVVVGGVAYTAGSKVPDDVAEQITNPAAWEEVESAPEPQESTPDERPRKQSSRRSS